MNKKLLRLLVLVNVVLLALVACGISKYERPPSDEEVALSNICKRLSKTAAEGGEAFSDAIASELTRLTSSKLLDELAIDVVEGVLVIEAVAKKQPDQVIKVTCETTF